MGPPSYIIIIIIIIIIIMFIDCKWIDTRWQWSFNMLHTHGLLSRFSWGGLHGKHAVATWKRNGNHPSICV